MKREAKLKGPGMWRAGIILRPSDWVSKAPGCGGQESYSGLVTGSQRPRDVEGRNHTQA